MKNQKPIKSRTSVSGAVAPLLMAAALVAVAPAVNAGKPLPGSKEYGSATLTAMGDELDAAGVAALNAKVTHIIAGYQFTGTLSLKCAGLTPNANYLVDMTGVTGRSVYLQSPDVDANNQGVLKFSSTFVAGLTDKGGPGTPVSISVYRVEPATNVLVLSGAIAWLEVKKLSQSNVLPSSLQGASACSATAVAQLQFMRASSLRPPPTSSP